MQQTYQIESIQLSNSSIAYLYIDLNQKTYQFINVVKGASHSHKTANIVFFI